jgi:hypothetical protein
MDSLETKKHNRKTIYMIIGAVALYLYLNISDPINMDISNIPIEFIESILLLIFYQRPDLVSEHILTLVLDTFLCLSGIFLWSAFFAQFVLPVRTLRERLDIQSRVFNQVLQEKGPAIFIENGEIKERLDERKQEGRGVILLDTASAAVLQETGKFSRAVGPGLAFTKRNERPARAIDLHLQERIIGPRKDDSIFYDEEDGDPLKDDRDRQDAREARRMQTSGLTRDGIEIVPNIRITFRLKADKDNREGGTFFGYRPASVESAILNEGIAITSDSEKTKMIPWDWLPAHLAADLWREYLRKFLLNQLFDIREAKEDHENTFETGNFDKTGLNQIRDMVNKRLTRLGVSAMDDVGNIIPNKKVESKEFKLLEKHGIIVTDVKIYNLKLKNEKKLIDRWEATWLLQAKIQRLNTRKKIEQWRQMGKQEALMEFSNSLITPLDRNILASRISRPSSIETLHELLRGTRTTIIRDPALNNTLADERAILDIIIEWVKKNPNEPQQNNP